MTHSTRPRAADNGTADAPGGAPADAPDLDLHELAQQLRVDSVRAAAEAGSGHPTSSMSAAELMAVLIARQLRYDFSEPQHPGNDHLVLSKGHASPLLYAAYKAVGAITDEELLTFRKRHSRLEGHPTPRLPWVDVATGSLGQGLPIAVGMALAEARLAEQPYRTWVVCGDSEMAEGSVTEALEQAGYDRLDRLTLIVDVNRLGQRGPTRYGWDLDAYARRLEAHDWHTVQVDGHDPDAVDAAYREAVAVTDRPTAILARTVKGQGVAAVADREGKHGKPLPDAHSAVAELGGRRNLRVTVRTPDAPPAQAAPAASGDAEPDGSAPRLPVYERGARVATRDAFGEALVAVGEAHPEVVVLDGEVGDSTRTRAFAEAHPERFFECYIAEQQLVAAAVGMQTRGWVPYASSFGAFLERGYEFVRMAAVSRARINLVGSHAGVAIGEDGPSQMALEDLAAFRAVHGSTVLHPCDAHQTARLVATMAESDWLGGVRYLRTLRGATPVIYDPEERFPIGGSKVLRSSDIDEVTLVAAGVTVPEALLAAEALAADGIAARVVDLYSVKPVDTATLREAAARTGRLLTVEDHHPEGGLGDAVLDAFTDGRHALPRLRRLAVRELPGSATPDEQLHDAGIDAEAIAGAARELIASD
ncbi:transketolase [Streptomyces sp. P38-E01]|uniref:Transketolase n=1 Tax=Streptomyces tardus TaxID=2780544 RepID=A0A949N7G1_9ACTN|nr:transketolase [Streptomyces tardus]MBU7597426.1 transketolase [Streptomyces tardus]